MLFMLNMFYLTLTNVFIPVLSTSDLLLCGTSSLFVLSTNPPRPSSVARRLAEARLPEAEAAPEGEVIVAPLLSPPATPAGETPMEFPPAVDMTPCWLREVSDPRMFSTLPLNWEAIPNGAEVRTP